MTHNDLVCGSRCLWLLAFVVFFFLPPPADACDCAVVPPPCRGAAAVGFAEAFAGTVTEIRMVDEPVQEGSRTIMVFAYRVRLTVDEAFTTLTAKEVVVRTAGHEAACGYAFTVGERYLVYANRAADDPTLHVSLCSGTKPLTSAFDDIELLRAARTGRISTRIFGSVSVVNVSGRSMTPQPGIKVVARRGSAEYVTTTDVDGHYRFSGLPFGRYTLRAWRDDDSYKDYHWDPLILSEKETCARANFGFAW